MLENIQASAPLAASSNVFTVIWQGIVYRNKHSGAITGPEDDDSEEFATDYATEVVPAEWGHLSIASVTKEEWLNMACGEEYDGALIYGKEMDLLHVIEGAVIMVELDNEQEPVSAN